MVEQDNYCNGIHLYPENTEIVEISFFLLKKKVLMLFLYQEKSSKPQQFIYNLHRLLEREQVSHGEESRSLLQELETLRVSLNSNPLRYQLYVFHFCIIVMLTKTCSSVK